MHIIYTLFLLATLASLVLYQKPRLAQKVGFGLASVLSLYATLFFFSNLGETLIWELPGNFISTPVFRLDSLGMFFSFLVSLIAFAVSLFSFDYVKFYESKANLAVFASLYHFACLQEFSGLRDRPALESGFLYRVQHRQH